MSNGIVLTCYENLEHTKINLELLRRMSIYRDSPIIVVTTSPNKEIQEEFCKLNNKTTKTIILNAPGNPGVNWEPPPGNYDTPKEKNSWRARYLPARLLYSMSVGFNELSLLDVNVALHLHSDTFWKPDHEYMLVEEQEKLKELYGIWDLRLEDKGWYVPLGSLPHPAPMHLNLKKCGALDIINFHKVFFHPKFKHYNFISVESLIGCWVNFCLCGQSVMGPEDKCCKEFYDKFKMRFKRFYHGNFEHLYSDPAQQGN